VPAMSGTKCAISLGGMIGLGALVSWAFEALAHSLERDLSALAPTDRSRRKVCAMC
jgi:hypothetical protein